MTIHQVREAQIALLLAKEVTIPAKNSDFANVFLKELAKRLPQCIGINKHATELEDSK